MKRRPLHIGSPLRLDRRGRSAAVDFDEYVRGLVETVLFTRPGERINRPEFGSGVDKLVFAPSDDELARGTQALVHGSLQRWLGDLLRIEDVAVEAVESQLTITVSYVPLGTDTGVIDRRVLTVTNAAGGPP